MEAQYLDYNEAKLYLQKKEIDSVIKWLTFTHSTEFPDFLPKEPRVYYYDKGWKGWEDFLSMDDQKPSRSFEKLITK